MRRDVAASASCGTIVQCSSPRGERRSARRDVGPRPLHGRRRAPRGSGSVTAERVVTTDRFVAIHGHCPDARAGRKPLLDTLGFAIPPEDAR